MIFWEKRDYYYCTCPLSFEHKYFVLRRKKWAGNKQDSVLSPFPPLLRLWNTGSRPNSLADAPASQPFTARSLVGKHQQPFFFFFLNFLREKVSGYSTSTVLPWLLFFFLSFLLSFHFSTAVAAIIHIFSFQRTIGC